MKTTLSIVAILIAVHLFQFGLLADSPAGSKVQFSQQAPFSTGTEIQRRFGIRDAPPTYRLTNESFQVILAPTKNSNSALGLFIWVSPNNSPKVPADWLPELAKHHII